MADKAKCKGYDLDIWKPEWSWNKFQANFDAATLCEVSDLLKGARKSAEEKLFAMAEGLAKKAATAYLDGITGGAFSMIMGSMDNSQSPLSIVVNQVDKIVEKHFEAHYQRMFNDEKQAYFNAYSAYLQGTGGVPFGAIVDKLNDPEVELSELEWVQLNHIQSSLERFDSAGNSLMSKGIFQPQNWKSASIYILITSQRLEVWKQLDFAMGTTYTKNIKQAAIILKGMRKAFSEWLDAEHPVPNAGGGFIHGPGFATVVRQIRQKATLEHFGSNYSQILQIWESL